MKRMLLVVLLAFVLAPAAFANCQDCILMQCQYPGPDGTVVTVDGSHCSVRDATGELGPGYENCRTLSPCRGCVGWTCYVKEPLDVELRVLAVTIEPEKPAADAPSSQD